MVKLWKKISDQLGLTRQEQLIVIFLLLGLLVGSGVSLYKKHRTPESQGIQVVKGGFQQDFVKKININQATREEIERLPCIGPTLARRIVEYRRREGGFTSVEDLKKVKGIGEKNFEKIKPYITVLNRREEENGSN